MSIAPLLRRTVVAEVCAKIDKSRNPSSFSLPVPPALPLCEPRSIHRLGTRASRWRRPPTTRPTSLARTETRPNHDRTADDWTTWAVAEHSPGHLSAGSGARRRDKWCEVVPKPYPKEDWTGLDWTT